MQRVLLFVEPKPLPDQLFRNSSWLTLPLRLLVRLQQDCPDDFELHVALPQRFRQLLNAHVGTVSGASLFGKRTYFLSEPEITRTIIEHGSTLRRTWESDFLGSTQLRLHQAVDDLVCEALPDLDWSLVLSFGETCRYSFARDAMKLSMESTSFARDPFKPSFFLDHMGLFRESALSRFGPELNEARDERSGLANRIASIAHDRIAAFQSLPFQRRFDRYVLLPLQASGYSSFDAQCNYDSQLDYLFDVCNRLGKDVGVLVTEHPEVSSIDQNNHFWQTIWALRSVFPNVTYLPRAKMFSSASLNLLDQMDAVWTTASNVGPVARLLGKQVGTPSDTHITYASTADSVEQLQEQLGQSVSSLPIFDWMFENYVIPWHVAEQPEWFANYLQQRIAAFKTFGNSQEAFVATELEVSDFVYSGDDKRSTARHAPVHRTMLDQKIKAFRQQQRFRLRAISADAESPSYALLNDTARLETYRHLGCNHVMHTIRQQMRRIGFEQAFAANGRDEVPVDSGVPDWVVINGEGSFHHNSVRMIELLDVAEQLRIRGARVALINSIWEENSIEHAERLRNFDIVAVRDSVSERNLLEAGINVQRTPDLSLEQWNNLSNEHQPKSPLLITDSIVYEKALSLFDASLILNGLFCLMDDRQLDRLHDDGCLGSAPTWKVSPNFLTNNCQIQNAVTVITGRFHVAIARLAMRLPFLFVESNTRKISNLCQDVRIPASDLDVSSELQNHDWARIGARTVELKQQWPQLIDSVDAFCRTGQEQITGLFDQIADLQRAKVPVSEAGEAATN